MVDKQRTGNVVDKQRTGSFWYLGRDDEVKPEWEFRCKLQKGIHEMRENTNGSKRFKRKRFKVSSSEETRKRDQRTIVGAAVLMMEGLEGNKTTYLLEKDKKTTRLKIISETR